MADIKQQLELEIIVDEKGAVKGVKKLDKGIKKTTDTTKKAQKQQQSFFKTLKLGYVAAAAGVFLAVKAIGKFVKTAAFQEKAERTLAAAMKQAGTYTKEAFEHNLKYASSLQKITTYGDEAILGVQKMLTNFKVEGEMLDKLTKATLDLAAAKGMDLKAASDLVAKSVGSSTNALTRYGIEVKGTVGSTERMQMAVTNITKLFGGAAAAEAATFSGSVTQMKNAIGDLAEKIGLKLFPVLLPFIKIINNLVTEDDDLITSTGSLIKLYTDWQDVLKKASGEVKGLTDEQKALNEVQVASAKFKFFAQLEKINKSFEEQTKLATKLKNKSNDYARAVEESTIILEKAEEQNKKKVKVEIQAGIFIKQLQKSTLSLAKAEKFIAITKLEGIKAGLKSTKINGELEQSITNLAIAQKAIKNINILSTISNKDLKLAIEERIKAITNGTFIIEKETKVIKKNVEIKKEAVKLTAPQIKALGELKNEALKLGIAESELTGKTIKEVKARIEAFENEENRRKRLIDVMINLAQEGFNVASQFMNMELQKLNETQDAKLEKLNETHEAELLALDEKHLAELEKAGGINEQLALIAEEAKQKRLTDLQEELDAALLAGDTELAREKENAIKTIKLNTEKDKILAKNANEKAALEEKLDKEKADLEKEHAIKSAKLALKTAKMEKVSGIIAITISTARAIAKGIEMFGPPPSPAGIAAIIAGGVIGAAQTVLVAAQPLPEVPSFALGGNTGITPGVTDSNDGLNTNLSNNENVFNSGQSNNLFNALETAGLLGGKAGAIANHNIDNSKHDSSKSSLNIEKLEVVSNDPEDMFNKVFDYAEDMGMRLVRRGG